ncbi:MAG: DUF4956 domain-containing protein [Bacteroidaceae bacterium]|nr:DUF4956 domain-containing protein [Bacteroidaceae bacterium]
MEEIFFGRPLVDTTGMLELLFRFFLNMTVVYTVVRCFYYPKAHRRDYLFTFLLFAVCIFLMIFLMEGSKLKIGAALGLFAIFGIIRYRTEAVPIREMTYLFFVVTISVVNAMAVKLSLSELLLGNLIFLFSSWALEHWLLSNPMESKYVKYDNIALITPDRRAELIEDLKARLGLDIVRVEVGSVDFLKDMALIRVYYITEKEKGNSVDHMTRLPKNYQ